VCRCDERLKDKGEGSTRLTRTYTGLHGGLEHRKIETRLIDEMSIFNVIRSVFSLARMLPILDLRCEENAARR
jgi:hypothetical protein